MVIFGHIWEYLVIFGIYNGKLHYVEFPESTFKAIIKEVKSNIINIENTFRYFNDSINNKISNESNVDINEELNKILVNPRAPIILDSEDEFKKLEISG